MSSSDVLAPGADQVPTLAGRGSAVRAGGARRRLRQPGIRRARTGGWSRSSRWGIRVGLGLGLAFYVVFGLVPAAATLLVSVTNYSGLAGATTQFTGLSQFGAAFSTERQGFIAGVRATAIFVVGVTVLQTVAALVLAHRLAADRRGNAFLRSLVFLPVVLGVTVVGLVWLLIFDPSQGPAADVIGAVGLRSSFFGSNALAMPLVILVQVWASVGFGTLVFIGGLKAIPGEFIEAAALDGVTWWVRFRRITWPLLAPSVTVVVLLAAVGSFTGYNLIYVLTDGLYGTNTLGMLAFTSAFGGAANLGYGAAISIWLFAMTLAVALPVQWWLRRREVRLVA